MLGILAKKKPQNPQIQMPSCHGYYLIHPPQEVVSRAWSGKGCSFTSELLSCAGPPTQTSHHTSTCTQCFYPQSSYCCRVLCIQPSQWPTTHPNDSRGRTWQVFDWLVRCSASPAPVVLQVTSRQLLWLNTNANHVRSRLQHKKEVRTPVYFLCIENPHWGTRGSGLTWDFYMFEVSRAGVCALTH